MDAPVPRERLPAEMTEYYVDDWLFCGLMPLRAGYVGEQHVHDYDHPSVIVSGTVRVWADGEDLGEMTGLTHVTIKAGVPHKFLAVTDAVILCVHNLRGEGYPATREG